MAPVLDPPRRQPLRRPGVGPGFSPKAALTVGLKAGQDAFPRVLAQQFQQQQVDLDDPATTRALLRLGAVGGVKWCFPERGALRSVSITRALCHPTVDWREFLPWEARRAAAGRVIMLARGRSRPAWGCGARAFAQPYGQRCRSARGRGQTSRATGTLLAFRSCRHAPPWSPDTWARRSRFFVRAREASCSFFRHAGLEGWSLPGRLRQGGKQKAFQHGPK
jgi:hypothetical protein